MPKIPGYEQKVRLTLPDSGRMATANDMGGLIAEGMSAQAAGLSDYAKGLERIADARLSAGRLEAESWSHIAQLGKGVYDISATLRREQEQADVAEVRRGLQEVRAQATLDLNERLNDPEASRDVAFAAKYMADTTKRMEQLQSKVRTGAGRRAFAELSASVSADMLERASIAQSKLAGQRAVQDFSTAVNAGRTTVMADPSQFQSVRRELQASLSSGVYAAMPAEARVQLERTAYSELATSALQGLIRQNPALAKQQLTDPELWPDLDADKRNALINASESAMDASRAEMDRLMAVAEKQKREADRALENDFVKRAFEGQLSYKDIIESPLDAPRKEHWFGVLRARTFDESAQPIRSNPEIVDSLQRNIFSGQSSREEIREAYVNRDISADDMLRLTKQLEDEEKNDPFQRDANELAKTVRGVLFRHPLAQVDPESAADGYYRFERDLFNKAQEIREAGGDPRELLNPNSKDYVLAPGRLKPYMPGTPRSVVQAEAQAMREGEPKPVPFNQAKPGDVVRTKKGLFVYKGGEPLPGETDPRRNVKNYEPYAPKKANDIAATAAPPPGTQSGASGAISSTPTDPTQKTFLGQGSQYTQRVTGAIQSSPELRAPDPVIAKADDKYEAFVQQMGRGAQYAAKALGVPVDVVLAQAALETAFGEKVVGAKTKSSNSPMNIKADNAWKGPKVGATTHEFYYGVKEKEVAAFRAYTSYDEGFDDYVKFLKTNRRYKAALAAKEPKAFITELAKAGYATDPQYAEKVIAIMHDPAFKRAVSRLRKQADGR